MDFEKFSDYFGYCLDTLRREKMIEILKETE
jgi:hypothetical protein